MNRETIARAALALIDDEGLDALNLRSLAARLGVGTTTLYQFVSGRDEIVTDVIGLLITEIDTAETPGESWDETTRRVARSVQLMAQRHPLAYSLVALAPEDRQPLLGHLRRLEQLLAAQQISRPLFLKLWSVLDAFITGFTLLETKAIGLGSIAYADDHEMASLAARLPDTRSAEAFGEGLEVVIAGLRRTYMDGEVSSSVRPA